MNVSFEKTTGKDEWLTPPKIISELGPFDLDPCSPINRPWNTADHHYTVEDDGLNKEWFGLVWCNPPYGRETSKWLERCKQHNNTIVLIFARTETKMFFEHVWNSADAVKFIQGRLRFYSVDGKQADSAGAPSVLIAYGKQAENRLYESKIKGKFMPIVKQL